MVVGVIVGRMFVAKCIVGYDGVVVVVDVDVVDVRVLKQECRLMLME